MFHSNFVHETHAVPQSEFGLPDGVVVYSNKQEFVLEWIR